MNIISHRGYWKLNHEKNTEIAFRRSFELDYGTETDVRDLDGELVVSHDIPTTRNRNMKLSRLFEIYNESSCKKILALNIKSDGLQVGLKKLLEEYSITNYFIFDMAVPDAIISLKERLVCYTRHSEYEPVPSFYQSASGVWLDEFYEDWITLEVLEDHLSQNKPICIVSPELHRRDPLKKWQQYKRLNKDHDLSNVTLCTDFPEKAAEFING